MSVFTELSMAEVGLWLRNYSLGTLHALTGIAEGVQNSNFFLDTSGGQYVLTVFEQVPEDQLPFYLGLLAHLAERGLPCPMPIRDRHAALSSRLGGKPAAIVSRLYGRSPITPTLAQCAAMGRLLARLHQATADFPTPRAHARDACWCSDTAAQLVAYLSVADADLLTGEIVFQQRYRPHDLPRGVIHADLFRDNVLFEGEQISGVLDFYFAGVDDLLFDLAVTVNDWCAVPSGQLDASRCRAFLSAYHAGRHVLPAEIEVWPIMLRAAALRFWLSRLQDEHLPRHGELVIRRDPEVYRRLLQEHIAAAESGHLLWPKIDAVGATSDCRFSACATQ